MPHTNWIGCRRATSTLLGLFLVLSGCGDTGEDAAAVVTRPNILWITVEDLSPHIGAYGDRLVTTPAIDRLASEGIRYAQAFATAPVCSAARSSLITGMYQSSIGAHQHRTREDSPLLEHRPYLAVPPPEVKPFTEYLRAAGYYCTNNVKTDYNFARGPMQLAAAWDEVSDEAHWRHRPDTSRPFFAVFNSSRTHESRVWPDPDEEPMLDPARVELPPYFPDTPVIRSQYARMLDNVQRVDRWAGDILADLLEDGLEDETVVFFFSDHGDGIPRGKRWLQDTGVQVPLIVRFPDRSESGTVETRLVSFVDFGPTVLSLAGVPVPDHMQGIPFLGDQRGTARDYVFAARDRMDEAHDMRRMVRDHRFKYIKNFYPDRPYFLTNEYRERMPLMQELRRLHESGELTGPAAYLFSPTKPPEELYDLAADPWEITNLATDPAYSDTVDRYREVLEDWMGDTGDLGLIPETELAERFWPGGVQPSTRPPEAHRVGEGKEGSALVSLSSDTEGASLVYRFATEGGEQWRLYVEPVTARATDTLEAVAIRYGYLPSDTTRIAVGRLE